MVAKLNLALESPLQSSRLASLLALLGAFAFGGLIGGCATTPTSDSTSQSVNDSVITTKVKSALRGDDAVKSFAVSVETVKGLVQLSGFVDTSAQKSAAGFDAFTVSGVKDVKNNIVVN